MVVSVVKSKERSWEVAERKGVRGGCERRQQERGSQGKLEG